ncbi:MAG: class I SAM-dependent methyltransferase [Planctomycetota bacterium]|nr:MAG: class I SAM-dependent methyltransferase [Planctomycetota bacterium]
MAVTDTTAAPETAQSEAFAEWMVETLNRGGLGLMLSIGHRAGLFDAMAGLAPASSVQIAERAGLNERYVREWLGAMVTGRVVEYDAASKRYTLPAAHAAYLTRDAGGDNIAATMQWLAVLGSVEDQIVERFRTGGGVDYCAYRRFHEVMAAESAGTVVAGLFEHILPIAPGLTQLLERGGARALDVGCGRGLALLAMAEQFPKSEFVGYDISEEATSAANAEAAERGLPNVRLVAQDAETFADEAAFDVVFAFDSIHDQKSPATVLANIRRALKPGGVFLMQDIAGSSHVEKNIGGALAPFVYTISCMHCMSVSLAQGGAGLGAAWGEELAEEMLGQAGLRLEKKTTLPHDILNVFYVSRPA